jgi:hypothetical protein
MVPKSLRALLTLNWPLASMNAHVRRQALLIFQSKRANLTRLRLLLVGEVLLHQMHPDQILAVEALLAPLAFEAALVLVLVRSVRAQLLRQAKALAANAAFERGGVARHFVNLHVFAQTVGALDQFAAARALVRRRAVHQTAVVAERGARLARVQAAGALAHMRALRRVRLHVEAQARHRGGAPPTNRAEEGEVARVLRHLVRAQLVGRGEFRGAVRACVLPGAVRAQHVHFHGGFLGEISRAAWFRAWDSGV